MKPELKGTLQRGALLGELRSIRNPMDEALRLCGAEMRARNVGEVSYSTGRR